MKPTAALSRILPLAYGLLIAVAQAQVPKLPPTVTVPDEKAAAAKKAAEAAAKAQKAADAAQKAQANTTKSPPPTLNVPADKAVTAKKAAEAADKAQKTAETAQKTTTVPKVVAVPKQAPAVTKVPVAAQGGQSGNAASELNSIDMAAKGAKGDNRPNAPSGPKPELPKAADSKATTEQQKSIKAIVDAIEGTGNSKPNLTGMVPGKQQSEQSSVSDALLQGDKSVKRPFDQGFGKQPTVDPTQAGLAKGGNPMSTLTGGPGIGGPLGEAAANSAQGSKGIASQGNSAVGYQPGFTSDTAAKTNKDGEVIDSGASEGAKKVLKDLGFTDQQANDAAKAATGIGNGRVGHEILDDPDGDPAGKESSKPASEPAPAPAPGDDGSTTRSSKDGRNVVLTDKDGTKNVYVDGKKVGTIAPDGTINPAKDKAGMPDPDHRGTRINVQASSAIQNQLRQAASGKKTSQGGSADSTPVDRGGAPVAVRGSAPVGSQEKYLVGNPGQRGGMREVGGGGVNVFQGSNGAGATDGNPNETNVNTGANARRDDPGSFFDQGGNRAPAGGPSRPPGGSQGGQRGSNAAAEPTKAQKISLLRRVVAGLDAQLAALDSGKKDNSSEESKSEKQKIRRVALDRLAQLEREDATEPDAPGKGRKK